MGKIDIEGDGVGEIDMVAGVGWLKREEKKESRDNKKSFIKRILAELFDQYLIDSKCY